jgi:hypothetical protein|uniref:Uncharacterized protein n=1 Tax=Phaeodactylum tricornutum TaxID=2850 RepID=A0A8J9SBK4_PHATR
MRITTTTLFVGIVHGAWLQAPLPTCAFPWTIPRSRTGTMGSPSRLSTASAFRLDSQPPKHSRLEGNLRNPTPEELAVMDEMIHKLADAKLYDLPNAVRRAFRVVSSPPFFLRIAQLSDQAANDTDREKLAVLAANLVTTLETVVETTEEQLDERAQEVERVVKAAAEPDTGEFLVPLLPVRVKAMREQLDKLEESSLDESFLSTVDAWMNKSHQDGMDLMVGILQKVLQLYAGRQVSRALDRQADQGVPVSPAHGVFRKLLETDADAWDTVLAQASRDELAVTHKHTMKVMESLVLSLETGSMAQRVQAEYLKELANRIESVQTKA